MSDFKTTSEGLEEISRLSLISFAPAEAIITDVKHLASYNWIEASTPTIAVPGSPAQWSAPLGPRQVKKDSGLVYISQNAARHPDSPLEPLFRSLYIEHPSFDINSIDIVTDRNNIRKLLSFVKPALSKNGLDAFTIQVDMTAQTAIFSRDETATYEVIRPGEFRGFGHEFEKAFTIPQVKGSTGHYRIISYRLGGLSFLVRHETDGYVKDLKSSVKDKKSTGDDLVDILNSLSLTPKTTHIEEPSVKSKLTIKKEGQIVSRESTLEIKTRVFHKSLELTEGGSSTIRYDPLKDKLVIKKIERKKVLPEDLYFRWETPIPATITPKSSVHSSEVTQKQPSARRPTAALDQDEALLKGIKVEPAKHQNVTITALSNKSQS
nr:hypothetical protein FAC1L15_02 [Penicillium camemberti]